jgi:hypothetical protein
MEGGRKTTHRGTRGHDESGGHFRTAFSGTLSAAAATETGGQTTQQETPYLMGKKGQLVLRCLSRENTILVLLEEFDGNLQAGHAFLHARAPISDTKQAGQGKHRKESNTAGEKKLTNVVVTEAATK